jgi:sec-independent protein translocase protein TatA
MAGCSSYTAEVKGAVMFGLGIQEILLLLLIALLLFGAKKLPDVGRALGESIREFKKAMSGEAADKKKTPETEKDAPRHGAKKA